MNFFKKVGSIFSKMTSSKRAEKVAEKVIQQEKKVEPIRDIEDIINGTKSPYFSPLQTRNQRIAKKIELKPIPSLADNRILETVSELVPKFVELESKKSAELKSLREDLKKLSKEDEGPLEILKAADPSMLVLKKTAKNKIEKSEVATESLKASKAKKNPRLPKIKTVKPIVDDPKEKDQLEIPTVPKQKRSPKKSPKAEKSVENLTDISEGSYAKTELSPEATKGKRKSKILSPSSDVKIEKWEPNNWIAILDNIKSMRANEDAPVDTMGCHKCSDENADEKTQRFQTLVALMLSSQTKDQVNYEAMKRLKENDCTPANISKMDSQKLESLLYPVSFYKNKAKYLKNASKILVEQYDSDIPNNVKELIKLPGVGPKMAHLCMSSAWDIVTGIGVDVHVHRISNRLGWVRKETKEPEQTRKELEAWLPSDRWREVNHLLVGFGQTICTPTKPKCGECLNSAICPSVSLLKRAKPKKEKAV